MSKRQAKSRLSDAPEHLISDVICRHWCFSSCTLLPALPDDPAAAAQVVLSSVDLLSWPRRISRLSLLPQWCSNDRTPHLKPPPPTTPTLIFWWDFQVVMPQHYQWDETKAMSGLRVVVTVCWGNICCLSVPLRGVWVGSWFLRFLAAAPQPSQRQAGSSAAADSHSDGFSSGLA